MWMVRCQRICLYVLLEGMEVNEITEIILGFLFGLVIGWIAFGMTVINECEKIGAFVAGGSAYVCEVKK